MKAAVCEKAKGAWQVKEIESPQVGSYRPRMTENTSTKLSTTPQKVL